MTYDNSSKRVTSKQAEKSENHPETKGHVCSIHHIHLQIFRNSSRAMKSLRFFGESVIIRSPQRRKQCRKIHFFVWPLKPSKRCFLYMCSPSQKRNLPCRPIAKPPPEPKKLGDSRFLSVTDLGGKMMLWMVWVDGSCVVLGGVYFGFREGR